MNSFFVWCIELYGKKPIEVALEYSKDSDAPVLDTIDKLCELIDGYSLYVRANINGKT